jgi:S-formylglutathione hydrolase FrmB
VSLDSLSIIDGPVPVVVVVLTMLSLLASIGWRSSQTRRRRRASEEWSEPELRRRPTWHWQLLVGVPVAAALAGLTALLVDGLAIIPYQFPNSFYAWFAFIPLAVVICVLGWLGAPWWRRIVSVISVGLACVFAFIVINQHYEYWPNVGALLGKEAQYEVDDAQLKQAQADYRHTKKLPDHGFTITKQIPGTTSGFVARDAYIWLPPAWVASPTPNLPVIMLLHGSPGEPADWTRAGFVDQTAQAYALDHDGKAPIIVMPDSNGSETADTECVNSKLGHVETYLTVDVPAFVRKTFNAKTADRSWVVAGESAGGMCSVMLALRHDKQFAAFGDYAGLTSPTVSQTVNPPATVDALFAGDQDAYNQHDPLWLLRNNRYEGLAGWFEVGLSDDAPLQAQRTLVPLARAAGILTCAREVPGQHDYTFVTQAFQDSLPWLAYRLGVGSEPPVAVTACSP